MQVEPNMIFPLIDCIFTLFLTIMTSQMAILLKRSILKNWSNFFHNSMYILGCCEEQFYGDHAHAGWTKYDFPPHRLHFYPISTHMTSQMAILLKRAILKKWPNFFNNSMYILGACEEQFYGDHTHLGRTKIWFPPSKIVFLHYFDNYDVTNRHFSQKDHPQKLNKLVSQLHVYPRMLRGAIL